MDVYQDTQVLRDAPDRQARAGIDEAAEAPRKSTTTAPQDRVSSHGSSLMVAALPRSRIGYRSSASTSRAVFAAWAASGEVASAEPRVISAFRSAHPRPRVHVA